MLHEGLLHKDCYYDFVHNSKGDVSFFLTSKFLKFVEQVPCDNQL